MLYIYYLSRSINAIFILPLEYLYGFLFAQNWDRINDTIPIACLADTEI